MGMSSPGSDTHENLPAIDEHIVAPGGRFECDDGELVEVPPADPPHAISNANLAWLLRAHVGSDLDVAVDMLTRTSRRDDIAPDASVFPRGVDPETGGRQLEHLAFEIASTQSLARAGSKAARLLARGVRRVFAVDLSHVRVLEWSRELATWSILDPEAVIADEALAVPLPIAALLHATEADDAVARALVAKGQPIIAEHIALAESRGIVQGRIEGRIEGRIDALIEGVFAVLAARGVAITSTDREQIAGERSPARLERWLRGSATCASVRELLTI